MEFTLVDYRFTSIQDSFNVRDTTPTSQTKIISKLFLIFKRNMIIMLISQLRPQTTK